VKTSVSEDPITSNFRIEVNRAGKWNSNIGRLEGLGRGGQEDWPEVMDEGEEVKARLCQWEEKIEKLPFKGF
jgi:hypothetical protein